MDRLLKLIFCLSLGFIFIAVPKNILAQSCPSQTQYSFNTANLVGEIQDTGNENNVQAWFEWGLSNSLGNSTPQQNIYVSSLPYRFCYLLTNLSPCTTYYYRAAVRNSQGIGYGLIYSFKTKCSVNIDNLNVSCSALPNQALVNSLVTFKASVSGGNSPYFYEWSGSCTGNSELCQTKFTSPGKYFAILKVVSGNETKFAVCSVNVVANQITNQPPVAIIAFTPEKIFPGTKVIFNASKSYDPDGTIVSYKWFINDKEVSNVASFSRTLASGSYRVKLSVSDNSGLENSKEILIYVGRNVYRTKTVPVSTPKLTALNNLADILIEQNYPIKICSSQNIPFTLVNNTSVNRKIIVEVDGEIKDWFQPLKRDFLLKPFSIQTGVWKVKVPCEIKPGTYEFILKLSTPGWKSTKRGLIEAQPSTNPFVALLGFIKGISGLKLGGWFLFALILLLISLGLNIYFSYGKFKEKNNKAEIDSTKMS